MPKYQVLQPIEKDSVMYVPKSDAAPKQLPSAGHGRLVAVDASGEIELTEEQASGLVYGQVPLFQGKPEPIGAAEFREKKAKRDAEDAAVKAAAEKSEYEEFVAFKAAKAAKATDTEEAPDAPTIKCVALKDFQFKGEKYKSGDEREFTFATIRAMGKERVKVLDVEAYEAAKKK